MLVLRKLVFAFGLLGLLIAQQASALGLGPAELKSALNQPLKADIQITNLGDLEEGDIVVTLASLNDFEKAGIAFLPFYNELRFELMLNHADGPLVRVTTREPVREPYLNFLVEARWATGRLLREYTFLLDLPTFDEQRAQQPVEAAAGQRRTEQPRQTPSERAAPSPRQQQDGPQVSQTGSASDVYGPVDANDTLWEIASQARPGRDLSVQQTMLAIQRKNPEAFINGNINLLRRGQVLRLPSRDEIQTVSQAQAVNLVAEQNRDWSQGARGAQLDAGRRDATPRREPSEVAGQVSLATPPRASEGDAGQGGGASEARGEELEQELATTLEELDKTRRENRELSSRVEELEAQIDTMESLIEASNEQLRALQLAAEQNRTQAAEQPAAPQEPEAGSDSPAETQAAPQPQAEPVEEPQRDPARVVRSAPEAPSLIERLMNNVVAVGAVLLALILLGGLFAWRRRQNQAGEAEEVEQDFAQEDLEAFESSNELEQGGQAGSFDLAEDSDREFENFDTLSDEETETGESETGDVVGEADIYIAYGKLDQAEEMLLKGLAKEPNSAPVLAKLLEVYAEKQDLERFDKHYATLLNTGDRDAIQRAGDLRDSIPDAGEFDVSAFAVAPGRQDEQAVEAESFEGEELDFSHLSDDLDSEVGAEGQDFGDLDFDLEEDLSTESGSQTSGDQKLELDDEFSFDLEDSETLDESSAQDYSKSQDAGQSRYDLSFDEDSSDSKVEADSEFSLDFDLDEELELDTEEPETKKESLQKDAEDEFSGFDLGLGEESKPADSEQPESLTLEDEEEAPTLELDDEDDFSFDLETPDTSELDALDEDLSVLDEDLEEEASATESSRSAEQAEPEAFKESVSEKTTEPSEAEQPRGTADQEDEFSFDLEETSDEETPSALREDDEADFDPNLEVGEFDLAALDEEMENLDADVPSEDLSESSSEDWEPKAPLEDQPEAAVSFEEDDVFEEALSDFTETEQEPEDETSVEERESEAESASEEELDSELDFLADADEAATKLDLARAYIDMGDSEGAKEILSEVSQEGNEEQRREAEELLERL